MNSCTLKEAHCFGCQLEFKQVELIYRIHAGKWPVFVPLQKVLDSIHQVLFLQYYDRTKNRVLLPYLGGSCSIVSFQRQSLKASTLHYRWWIIYTLKLLYHRCKITSFLLLRYFHGRYSDEVHSPVPLVRSFTAKSYHIIDTVVNHSHSFRIGKMAVWFGKLLKIRYFMEQIPGKILLRLLRSSRTTVICPTYPHNLKFIRP